MICDHFFINLSVIRDLSHRGSLTHISYLLISSYFAALFNLQGESQLNV